MGGIDALSHLCCQLLFVYSTRREDQDDGAVVVSQTGIHLLYCLRQIIPSDYVWANSDPRVIAMHTDVNKERRLVVLVSLDRADVTECLL